jgi:hypothetical protein
VRQRLAAHEGPVPVLHAGPDAWYVGVGGWAVGVLSREAARVPCGLRSTLPGRALGGGDGAAKSGYVEHGTLWLGGQAFRPVRSVDVRAPRITLDHGFRRASSVTVQATPPALVAEFVRGVLGCRPGHLRLLDDLDDDAMADLAGPLLGRGPGLTPLGDDVLCGWLAAHRAVGVPTPRTDSALADLRGATTLLSATLLDCALHGEVLPELGSWLAGLGTPHEPALLSRLSAIGATSGAGLAAGSRLALLSLTSQKKVPA